MRVHWHQVYQSWHVCAHKPSTLPSSHTNMHCGSMLIAMSACLVIKFDPWWQKQHVIPLMLTMWLHNNTTSPVINLAESAFLRRSLSLSQTHILIEGNYRAVCWVKTSARGRMVLRDERSDPDGPLEPHWSQILHISWTVLGFRDTNKVKAHLLPKKSNMV